MLLKERPSYFIIQGKAMKVERYSWVGWKRRNDGIGNLEYGIRNMTYGKEIWNMEYGIWNMEFEYTELEK